MILHYAQARRPGDVLISTLWGPLECPWVSQSDSPGFMSEKEKIQFYPQFAMGTEEVDQFLYLPNQDY